MEPFQIICDSATRLILGVYTHDPEPGEAQYKRGVDKKEYDLVFANRSGDYLVDAADGVRLATVDEFPPEARERARLSELAVKLDASNPTQADQLAVLKMVVGRVRKNDNAAQARLDALQPLKLYTHSFPVS